MAGALDPFATTAAALAKAWMAAWNAHDMDAAARLLTPEVEFVTVAGLWLRGREEFLDHHRRIHAMQMRDSRWVNVATNSQSLRDDFALVHLEWAMEGDREPDGRPRPPRRGIFTWLVVRGDDGAWRIAAAQNTNLRDDIRHRLSGSEAASPT
jgi:uncharacterized protein (TIGR02246 family)